MDPQEALRCLADHAAETYGASRDACVRQIEVVRADGGAVAVVVVEAFLERRRWADNPGSLDADVRFDVRVPETPSFQPVDLRVDAVWGKEAAHRCGNCGGAGSVCSACNGRRTATCPACEGASCRSVLFHDKIRYGVPGHVHGSVTVESYENVPIHCGRCGERGYVPCPHCQSGSENRHAAVCTTCLGRGLVEGTGELLVERWVVAQGRSVGIDTVPPEALARLVETPLGTGKNLVLEDAVAAVASRVTQVHEPLVAAARSLDREVSEAHLDRATRILDRRGTLRVGEVVVFNCLLEGEAYDALMVNGRFVSEPLWLAALA